MFGTGSKFALTNNCIYSCTGHPSKEDIEKEFAAFPLSLDELEAVEDRLQASLKSRPRSGRILLRKISSCGI